MIATYASHNATPNPFKDQIDKMCVGISGLESRYADGTATNQQILDETKAMILARYANFSKAQMGGVDIKKALDAGMFSAPALGLLNIQVNFCAIFKEKGYQVSKLTLWNRASLENC